MVEKASLLDMVAPQGLDDGPALIQASPAFPLAGSTHLVGNELLRGREDFTFGTLPERQEHGGGERCQQDSKKEQESAFPSLPARLVVHGNEYSAIRYPAERRRRCTREAPRIPASTPALISSPRFSRREWNANRTRCRPAGRRIAWTKWFARRISIGAPSTQASQPGYQVSVSTRYPSDVASVRISYSPAANAVTVASAGPRLPAAGAPAGGDSRRTTLRRSMAGFTSIRSRSSRDGITSASGTQ